MKVGDFEVRYTPQVEGLVLGVSLHTACERDGHLHASGAVRAGVRSYRQCATPCCATADDRRA
ncbi:hypothetical protein AB5I41_27175 [Sphingomonas sp. MMS24-JH45]